MSTIKAFDIRSNLNFTYVALTVVRTKHAQKLHCIITQNPEVTSESINLIKS